MSDKFWTENRLKKAVEALENSETVKEAASKLEVSTSALRNAFAANELQSPSNYLEQYNELDYVDGTWDFSWDEEEYEFRVVVNTPLEKETFVRSLTFDDVEKMCVMYSEQDGCFGMTSKDVVDYFVYECGYTWMTYQFVLWALKSMGIVHKSHAIPPHMLGKSKSNIFATIRQQKENILKYQTSKKHTHDYVEELENQLEEIFNACKLTKHLLNESSMKFDHRDVHLSKDGKGLVIAFGDAHAGKKVDNTNVLAKKQNEYSEMVFKQRVENMCAYIRLMAHDCRDDIEYLYALNLGDNFESLLGNMRDGMMGQMYNHHFDQYRQVKAMNEAVLQTLLEEFPGVPIRYVMVPGNHDRMLKDKAAATEVVLMDIFCDHLQDKYEHYDNLEILPGAPVSSVYLPNGVNLIFSHGHLKAWKDDNKVNNAINIHGYGDAERYLLFQGHYHSFHLLSGYNWRMHRVPAIVGNDEYSLNHIEKGNRPAFIGVLTCQENDLLLGPYNLDTGVL